MTTSDAKKDDFSSMMAALDARGGRRGAAREPRAGDEVSGTVVAIGADCVFVDIGGKAEAQVARAELVDDDGTLKVAVGDALRARIASTRDGRIVLRVRLGRGDASGSELLAAHQAGIPVVGKVTGVNKGGLDVEVAGVRAFCPISQIDAGFVQDPGAFVGKELEFLVTRCDVQRGENADVVLSRKALLDRQRAELAAATRSKLEPGAIVRGSVVRLKDYGAFVDLGGVEGLVHVSEMGFGRISHPKDAVSVGDVVEVQVLGIEPGAEPGKPERIRLSLKALQTDPWGEAQQGLGKGSVVHGKVVRLESFGAFVELPNGLEGLLHVSEMVEGRRLNHAREVLSVGQEIDACVVEVDPSRRRIGLSLKAVAAREEAALAANYRPAGSGSLGTFADLMRKKLGK